MSGDMGNDIERAIDPYRTPDNPAPLGRELGLSLLAARRSGKREALEEAAHDLKEWADELRIDVIPRGESEIRIANMREDMRWAIMQCANRIRAKAKAIE